MNFSLKDHLPTAVRDAIFEEESAPGISGAMPQSSPSQMNAVTLTPISQQTSTSTEMLNSLIGGAQPASLETSDPDPFLPTLAAKTDFDSTPVGQQVKEHLLPLEGLPLSDAQKMQAVLKAGAKDGLTAEEIVSTYQSFLTLLKAEEATFNSAMAHASDAQVGARQRAIQEEADTVKDLEARITASREKQSQLSSELISAQSNIQRKQAQFQAALSTRTADINGAIAHYQQILSGGN